MGTDHNRIKVADLEINQRNRILTTKENGELEFSDIDAIKVDSYNALDYDQEGKALDARQGKVLKDLIDHKWKPQITITTGTNSITTNTVDADGFEQQGRNVIINNSNNNILITVNGGINTIISYTKLGAGTITFVQGIGRTLTLVDGTAVFDGAVGSTATLVSVGTVDLLRISNA